MIFQIVQQSYVPIAVTNHLKQKIMTDYCGAENKKIVENKDLELCSLNEKHQTQNSELNVCANSQSLETKRKQFKIPDHITSVESN